MQRQPFDTEAWARDYFKLSGQKAQEHLQTYLQLSVLQEAIPADVADEAGKLAWATDRAAQELREFVQAQIDRLAGFNITAGHRDHEAAVILIESFRHGTNPALDQWCDPSTAMAHAGMILNGLGLTYDSNAPCEADPAPLGLAVLQARDYTAAGRESQRSLQDYEADCRDLSHKVVVHSMPQATICQNLSAYAGCGVAEHAALKSLLACNNQ